MSRTLRRPMFRGGGKIESRGTGITSGLDDRPGYQDGPGPNVMDRVKSDFDQLQELKNQLGLFDVPKEKTFLGLGAPEFLALAQRGFEFAGKGGDQTFGQKLTETAGDALGDISTSLSAKRAKKLEREREDRLLKSGDLETIYEETQKAERERIKGDASKDAKSYNVEVTDALIQSINQNTFELEQQLKNTTDENEKVTINQQLKVNKDRLNKLLKGDTTFLDYFLRQDEAMGGKFGKTVNKKIQLEAALQILLKDPVANKTEIDKTTQAISQLNSVIEGYSSSIQDVQSQLMGSNYSQGGRVGFANGGNTTNMEMPNSNIRKSDMPSFDLLRTRLPDSISDEVVRLLSVSPQALSDFSQIKTEQDIEDFNQTYQVSLAVPTVS
jgi:hypothetical protein